MSRHPEGTIYLLHFDQPVSDHARHYLGWASDLAARLEAHREGRGARLMEVVKERGITWRLARTWEGTRGRERAIKDRKESPKLCPDCTPNSRPVAKGRSAAPMPEPKAPPRNRTCRGHGRVVPTWRPRPAATPSTRAWWTPWPPSGRPCRPRRVSRCLRLALPSRRLTPPNPNWRSDK